MRVTNTLKYTLAERDIYGSKRIGADFTPVQLIGALPVSMIDTFGRYLGMKQYEMDNHLGNVLATVSDRKIPISLDTTTGTAIDHYEADVLSSQDYYGFGMEEPGRNFNSTGYRFGFNGKLKDDDIYGAGNSYDYGKRFFDPRLGRPMSIDPLFKKYPMLSPYQFFSDNPIWNIDLDGLEGIPAQKQPNGGYTTAITSVWKPQPVQIPIATEWYLGPYTPSNEGTIDVHHPGKMEKLDNILNSKSSNVVAAIGKFFGRAVYSSVNDMYIYGSNVAFGPEKARDLTGTGVDRKQILDAGVLTIAPSAMIGVVDQLAKGVVVQNIADFSITNKGSTILSDPQAAGSALITNNIAAKQMKALETTADVAKDAIDYLPALSRKKDNPANKKDNPTNNSSNTSYDCKHETIE